MSLCASPRRLRKMPFRRFVMRRIICLLRVIILVRLIVPSCVRWRWRTLLTCLLMCRWRGRLKLSLRLLDFPVSVSLIRWWRCCRLRFVTHRLMSVAPVAWLRLVLWRLTMIPVRTFSRLCLQRSLVTRPSVRVTRWVRTRWGGRSNGLCRGRLREWCFARGHCVYGGKCVVR